MITEPANQLDAKFGIALKPLVIEQPNRRTFYIAAGSVFLASPSIAHGAALAGLCRTIDPATDMAAPCESDRALFAKHGAGSFRIPYDGALAVRIEQYVEPKALAPIIIEVIRPAPVAPVPLTGFEHRE